MKAPTQAAPVHRGIGRARSTNAVMQAGCDLGDWLACAGTIALCATQCAISPWRCAICMGTAYDRCKDCI